MDEEIQSKRINSDKFQNFISDSFQIIPFFFPSTLFKCPKSFEKYILQFFPHIRSPTKETKLVYYFVINNEHFRY